MRSELLHVVVQPFPCHTTFTYAGVVSPPCLQSADCVLNPPAMQLRTVSYSTNMEVLLH